MGVCNSKDVNPNNLQNYQAAPADTSKAADQKKNNPFLAASQKNYQDIGTLGKLPTPNQDKSTESTKNPSQTAQGENGTQAQPTPVVKTDPVNGNQQKKPEEASNNQQTTSPKPEDLTQKTQPAPQNQENASEKEQPASQGKPSGQSTVAHRNPFTAAAKRNTEKNIPFKEAQEEAKSSRKVLSVATSKDTQTFLFVEKKQPSESFYLEINKGDEEVLTLREIIGLISKKLEKSSIHIQETYYSDSVDLGKTLGYYADCGPFYFQFTKIHTIKCQSKVPGHEQDSVEVEISSHQPLHALYEQVRDKLKFEKVSFQILLNRPGKDAYIIPRSSKTLKFNDEEISGASLVVQSMSEEVPLKIKMSSEINISLSCSLDAPVEELLYKISENQGGVRLNETLVKFEGKQLALEKTLKEYDIKSDSELEVVTMSERKKQFVEATTLNKGEKTALNESGSAWREVSPGVCVQGKCTNEICPSFGNGNVIIQLGYGTFDLSITNVKTYKCPMCNLQIESVSHTVNNCDYIISGLQKGKEGKQTGSLKQQWKSIGEEYLLVDPHKEEPEDWKPLKVHARKLGKNQLGKASVECAICKVPVDSEQPSSCGHFHHQECVNKTSANLSVKCALCLV